MSTKQTLLGEWGRAAILSLFLGYTAHGQGGKPFIEWLKQYSPTGYFIINDWETKGNKPGDHLGHVQGQTVPLCMVAVHECGHMRNLAVYTKGDVKSYYIGDKQDYALNFGFKPFSSAEMIPDLPASLHTFQTEVYIEGGEGIYAVGEGMIGIMEEWNQYSASLLAASEMGACFKANFNTPAAWKSYAEDGNTSIHSTLQFRWFVLKYIQRAQKSHPDVYAKITASPQVRQIYTHLVDLAEKAAAEWTAVLKSQNLNTTTSYGYDDYWKFQAELQKPEFKALEQIMLVPAVSIQPLRPESPGLALFGETPARFDLRGRWIPGEDGFGETARQALILRAGEAVILAR